MQAAVTSSAQGVLCIYVRQVAQLLTMAPRAPFHVRSVAMGLSHLPSSLGRGPSPRTSPGRASRLRSARAQARSLSPLPWRPHSASLVGRLTARRSPRSDPRSAAWAARDSHQWSSTEASAWELRRRALPLCPAPWTGTSEPTLLGARGWDWGVRPPNPRAGSHGSLRSISVWLQEEGAESDRSTTVSAVFLETCLCSHEFFLFFWVHTYDDSISISFSIFFPLSILL